MVLEVGNGNIILEDSDKLHYYAEISRKPD